MNLVQLKMREARPPKAGKLLASPAVAGQTCLPAGREGEPTKTFPNWRCAFEKNRTDFAQNL